ncbi:MAG: hypothetical protein ACFFCM_04080 [Promethearchaeota archaeon]
MAGFSVEEMSNNNKRNSVEKLLMIAKQQKSEGDSEKAIYYYEKAYKINSDYKEDFNFYVLLHHATII